jgi:hypothetical protein
MPSSLSWIDFDSEAQQRAQRILTLFKERDTRDELGFGPIRDAISDSLFPGTSTIHTRLRYMLFIPWAYISLEAKGVSSKKISKRARTAQLQQAAALKENAPGENGVIGGDIGDKLKTLPSAIYWAGLGRWGLRVYPGTEGQYHRALDDVYRRRKKSAGNTSKALEDGDDIGGLWESGAHSFHPGLPDVPENFPEDLTFELDLIEARYLQERIRQSCPDSLLADLMASPVKVSTDYPWEHPHLADFRQEHQHLLWHGRHFSTVAHGAAILYNQLLAEKRADEMLLEQHCNTGHVWLSSLAQQADDVAEWANDLPAFWAAVKNRGYEIEPRTVIFVERWIELLLQYRDGIFDQRDAKKLIYEREIEKKRANSRFTNSRVLDQWGGSSGLTPMSYRWQIAQSYIADMAAAVKSST